MNKKVLSESVVIDIRRRTHKMTSSEEKIRIGSGRSLGFECRSDHGEVLGPQPRSVEERYSS